MPSSICRMQNKKGDLVNHPLSETYRPFTNHIQDLFILKSSNYIGTAHERPGTKVHLKADNTPVGDLDNEMLASLRRVITSTFRSDQILGEEDNRSDEAMQEIIARANSAKEGLWTADGLDGTGNLRMGLESFGAYVSRSVGDELVYVAGFRPVDFMLRGTGFFCAEKGKGAWEWCNPHQEFHRLDCTVASGLERMVVMLEGSSKKFFKAPLTELGKKVTTRPSFSTCVASTTVARGLASAFVTEGNKPWDNWPAWLIIQEAGGTVTDWQGAPAKRSDCGNMIAAATREIGEEIVALLNQNK